MRKLAEGQQAMILVKAGGLFQSSQRNGVSRNRLEFASMVQYYAPELGEEVFNGMTSLDHVYGTAPISVPDG